MTDRLVDPLPPRARLLHIGLAKTGTTTVQRAAARNRAQLLEHGVRYPGHSVNHRHQVAALMRHNTGWAGPGRVIPRAELWTRLMDEIRADTTNRIFVSHESIAWCTDEQAQRFVDELGPDLYVAVTLRGWASLLPSRWQQYIKDGLSWEFEPWLRAVLADPPDKKVTPSFYTITDQTAIVQRWVKLVGPDRVFLIVGDKDRHDLLTDAFADLLDVPRELMRGIEETGDLTNRGLSFAEVELLRRVNTGLRKDDEVEWGDYNRVVRLGMVPRIQRERTPDPRVEPSPVLPAWAAELAEPRARMHADNMAASGAHVIGDLTSLYAPVKTVDAVPETTSVPLDVAAEAVLGAVFAALEDPTADLPVSDRIPQRYRETAQRWKQASRRTADIPLSGLLAAATLRVFRRAGRIGRRRRA